MSEARALGARFDAPVFPLGTWLTYARNRHRAVRSAINADSVRARDAPPEGVSATIPSGGHVINKHTPTYVRMCARRARANRSSRFSSTFSPTTLERPAECRAVGEDPFIASLLETHQLPEPMMHTDAMVFLRICFDVGKQTRWGSTVKTRQLPLRPGADERLEQPSWRRWRGPKSGDGEGNPVEARTTRASCHAHQSQPGLIRMYHRVGGSRVQTERNRRYGSDNFKLESFSRYWDRYSSVIKIFYKGKILTKALIHAKLLV